jgi:hypothetical protein
VGHSGTYIARAFFPGMEPAVAAESRRILAAEVMPLIARG